MRSIKMKYGLFRLRMTDCIVHDVSGKSSAKMKYGIFATECNRYAIHDVGEKARTGMKHGMVIGRVQ